MRPDRLERYVAAVERYFEEAERDGAVGLPGPGSDSVEGWFLGPKGENAELLKSLVGTAIDAHVEQRRAFHPEDPEVITEEVKSSRSYKAAVEQLRAETGRLFELLKQSMPYYSMRYQGHMNWDTTLPAMVGYIAAMLYNPNNVGIQASPVTTKLEMEVGSDLCRLVGFEVPSRGERPSTSTPPVPWGHITADGSVANIEAFWTARNVKLFPIALRAALDDEHALRAARELQVRLLDGRYAAVADLDTWTLLNLPGDSTLSLPQRMHDEYGIAIATTGAALAAHSVQNLGLEEFRRRYLDGIPEQPVAFAPITKHYSWPKGAALSGVGASNLLDVLIDEDARQDADHLRHLLEECLERRRPVYTVIVVIGSTEESAVDPLRDVLAIREEMRAHGLDFTVHADAAWGGYLASLIRENDPRSERGLRGRSRFVPSLPMSRYVTDQYESLGQCDSVTVDPHKGGYVPYPAGGLCYRNSAMRWLVSFLPPVAYQNVPDPLATIHSLEGSKPGAARAAVYLSHRVIRTTKSGYGKLLGECMFTAKRLYARLVSMTDDRFAITCFNRLPAQRAGGDRHAVERQLRFIRERIVGRTNEELLSDTDAMALLQELGSDQLIVPYAFNFFTRDGRLNASVDKANELNEKVFAQLSLAIGEKVSTKNLVVGSSEFGQADYGPKFMQSFCARLGVEGDEAEPITFMFSTVMDPWTTETPGGSFLAVVEQALRDAVHTALSEMST